MDLSEDQIIGKYAKHCGHCNQNTLLPYEYEIFLSHVDITK